MEANFQIYHYWRSQCAMKGVSMSEKQNQEQVAHEELCCSGHEHGHGHDHVHDHRDHDHTHDHHDHSHAHDHDHTHDCHNHSHDHEHTHDHHHHGSEVPSVSVYTHEIATVGSVKCRIGGNYEEVLEKLKHCMKETAEAVEEAGGLIGHVKAFAREEARTCMISITEGEDMQCRQGFAGGIYVESANIVFGIAPAELKAILKKAFREYL